MIGNSRRKTAERTVSGASTAVAPSTSPIFTIFEPIALPIAKVGLPLNDATAETSISGADVAKPTMTSPTNSGCMPKWNAVAAAPSMKRSAP